MPHLPKNEMEALAKVRRITFANRPDKPEAVKGADADDVSIKTTTGIFPVFRTHVKIFVVSTGDDSGSNCELQGYIDFTTGTPTSRDINVELPVLSSWATENGGLGRFLVEFSRDTTSAPASFRTFLFEDDWIGDEIVLNWGIDWTNPIYMQYADGRAWTVKSWNLGDPRYCVKLWWKVTRLS